MDSRLLYRGKIFDVEEISIKKRGRVVRTDRIVNANTVIVIPLLDKDTVLLERQFRYALNRYLYELPAGYIEKGETPEEAARRELEEETGYLTGDVELMLKAYVSPGNKTEIMHFVLAKGLRKTKTRLDPDEIIETRSIHIKDALSTLQKNPVVDMKSVTALLYYLNRFSNRR